MPELDDTQQRLLAAAGPVFAENGFARTTIRDILAAAKVRNAAAVNYHFGDKEGLYKALLDHSFRCHAGLMPDLLWPDGTSPRTKLRQFIRGVVRHLCNFEHPWQVRLLMRELTEPTPAGAEFVRSFIRPIYQMLWQLLREILPAAVSEEKLHLIAFSIMGQGFYHRVNRHGLRSIVGEAEYDRLTLDDLADHIAEFSLAALGLGPAYVSDPSALAADPPFISREERS